MLLVYGTNNLSLNLENSRWKSQSVLSNQETEAQEMEGPSRS